MQLRVGDVIPAADIPSRAWPHGVTTVMVQTIGLDSVIVRSRGKDIILSWDEIPNCYERVVYREIADIKIEPNLEQEKLNTALAQAYSSKNEFDPLGIAQHAPGAKLDAGKNRLGLVFDGFAHALEHVGRVGTYGANKYTDNGWKQVPNGVARYTDALYRHLLAEKTDGLHDVDTGILHAAHAAWNALARLELLITNGEKKQCTPGS